LIDRRGIWVIHKERKGKTKDEIKQKYKSIIQGRLRLGYLSRPSFSLATVPKMLVDISYTHERI